MIQNQVKMLAFSRNFIIDVLNWMRNPRDEYLVFDSRDVPEDAIVESVWWSDPCRCWFALLWHESFEAVPDGVEPPRIETSGLTAVRRYTPTRDEVEKMHALWQARREQRIQQDKENASLENERIAAANSCNPSVFSTPTK